MSSILKIKILNNVNNDIGWPTYSCFREEVEKKDEKKIRLKPRLMIWKSRSDKEKLCSSSFYPTFFSYRRKTTRDWKNQPLRVLPDSL